MANPLTELHQPTCQLFTDQASTIPYQMPGMSGLQTTQDSNMDTDSDSDPVYQPASGFEEERELSDPEHDLTATETDQTLSEEQSYRETLRGIRSFMDWTHILDVDTSSSSAYDNLFTAPKTAATRQDQCEATN